ncbi:Folate-binding protein OS=Streptomyces alboniger OX=132473 GN=CP975_16355 PE=4 SV=1 [Streptomyces alboniger]
MKSPLLTLPGAVPAEGVGRRCRRPLTAAAVLEQRALADARGFVDLSHRGVVTVSGVTHLG